MTITTEELQRLVDANDASDPLWIGLAPYLARRVLAAEKLVKNIKAMEGEILLLQSEVYQNSAVWDSWEEFFEDEDTSKKMSAALSAYEATK